MGAPEDFGNRLGEALEEVRAEIRAKVEEKHRLAEEARQREGQAREYAYRFWHNTFRSRLDETARKIPNASVIKEDATEDKFSRGFTADIKGGQVEFQLTVTLRNDYHELLMQSTAFFYPESTGSNKPAGKSLHSGSESFLTDEFNEEEATAWLEDELIQCAAKAIAIHEAMED